MVPQHTSYYQSNLDLLETHHPVIWEKMIGDPPQPAGTIFHAPGGAPNLTVTTHDQKLVTLHKESDPESESHDFQMKIPEDHKGFISILGMGLGYHILDILKTRPLLQHLAVFELDPGVFVQALTHMDLFSLLTDPRLILSVGKDWNLDKDLAKASRILQLEDAHIYDHLPSYQLHPDGYADLKTRLYSYLNSLNVGGATTRALGKDFMKNRFEHASTIHHHYLLETLYNRFSNTPAILVAGGPSLDMNLEYLKAARENAVIFAVDTVLPTLLNNDILPHFLASIDPNSLTYEKFADVVSKARDIDISLICASWVNLRTAKVFPARRIFWTFTSKPVEAWINTLLGGNLLTGGSSTVAHLNLIAAHMLGCDPIIFIGQDLAFPGRTTHARGTVLQGTSPEKTVLNQGGLGQTVKGTDGTVLRTNRSFLSMKNHFENAIAKAPQLHINSSLGGAHIEGTTPLPLKEAVDKYCSEPVHANRRIIEYSNASGKTQNDRMLSELSGFQDRISALRRTIRKADDISLSLLRELSKKSKKRHVQSFNDFSRSQQKAVRKIDACHNDLDSAIDIWQILEEVTMDGIKDSERRKKKIAMFERDPKNYSKWMVLNLQRLIEINSIRKQSLKLLSEGIECILHINNEEERLNIEENGRDSSGQASRIELIELYMDTGNYFLAYPLLEKMLAHFPESGKLNYFAGCIATLFNETQKASRFFKTACRNDPKIKNKIESFKENLGNDYYSYARYFKSQPGRKPSIRHMVFKGLTVCPHHKKLSEELEHFLKDDLTEIEDCFETKQLETAIDLVNLWDEKIEENKSIRQHLPKEQFSRLLYLKGKLFLENRDYPKALLCFEDALSLFPENQELHFITIDTHFMASDYNGAVQAIERAVQIDRQFAAYFETIGDSLKEADQHEDAIVAYERCFTTLPERIDLLKKIGECYLATGQLEAAKACIDQFKVKIEKHK